MFQEHSIKLSDLGGMSHQSAAKFVFDQRNKTVFAMAASEDGKVSGMDWDETKKMITVMRHIE